MFRQATPEGRAIRAWFESCEGLMAKGGEVTGLRLPGRMASFEPATATIDGRHVAGLEPELRSRCMFAMGGPTARSATCSMATGCRHRRLLSRDSALYDDAARVVVDDCVVNAI